jgi:hypothetical protein
MRAMLFRRRLVTLTLAAAALAVVSSALTSTGYARPAVRPLQFKVPGKLPKATVGEPYEFSFCQPKPKAGGRCGKVSGATNPSGGFGFNYLFTLHGRSHLPPGLLLSSRTGILRGTPKADAKAGPYRFTVCVSDAGRHPGVAPKPSCRTTQVELVGPADFTGSWNGTFSATLSSNACASSVNGNVRFSLSQQGSTVSGSASYTITGGTMNPNADPNSCDDVALTGTINLSGTVNGTTLSGSGFTLTQTSATALTGTFEGTVQGVGVKATVAAGR